MKKCLSLFIVCLFSGYITAVYSEISQKDVGLYSTDWCDDYFGRRIRIKDDTLMVWLNHTTADGGTIRKFDLTTDSVTHNKLLEIHKHRHYYPGLSLSSMSRSDADTLVINSWNHGSLISMGNTYYLSEQMLAQVDISLNTAYLILGTKWLTTYLNSNPIVYKSEPVPGCYITLSYPSLDVLQVECVSKEYGSFIERYSVAAGQRNILFNAIGPLQSSTRPDYTPEHKRSNREGSYSIFPDFSGYSHKFMIFQRDPFQNCFIGDILFSEHKALEKIKKLKVKRIETERYLCVIYEYNGIKYRDLTLK